jgi:internalin A
MASDTTGIGSTDSVTAGTATTGGAAKATEKPRRPGLRFSLRAFLGGITLFCILLAWQLHRARQQRESVAAIRAAGGWVHYDYQNVSHRAAPIDSLAEPWEPDWLLALVGIDFFHSVTEVNMVYNEDGPQRLENDKEKIDIGPHLAQFPRLRSLLVSGPSLSDASMASLGKLRRLQTLYYWNASDITDAGVQHLRGLPRLNYIHLSASQVGDDGLAAIATLPSLEGLSMQQNRITDAGLAHLAGHPTLKELWIGDLRGLSPITDTGVKHLATISQLEELDLQYTRVTPAGLKPLQALPNLKSLLLSGSKADDYEAVAPLFPRCTVDARR